jgi:hypothetical protein
VAASVVATLALCSPASAAAQETRAEQIAAQQKEKAATLTAYQPTRFERLMTRLEESFASPPSGFFPAFGSVYPGGGLTPGVGYRQFFARNAVFDIVGLYSIKNYKSVEVGVRTPWHGNGRWWLGTRVGWLDAPQVGYYGQGMAPGQPRANFRLTETYGSVTAGARPGGWTRLQGEVAYEAYRTEEGRGRHPSIETLYTTATTPGLVRSRRS